MQRLEQIEEVQVTDPTTLCLSLDYSHRLHPYVHLLHQLTQIHRIRHHNISLKRLPHPPLSHP